MRIFLMAAAAALVGMVSTASAMTMTFDNGAGTMLDTNFDGTDDIYLEDGISMAGFIDGFFNDDWGTAHLDNPGDGHFTDRLVFWTGSRFNLKRFDLLPSGSDCYDQFDLPCDPYKNVIVTGLRGSVAIAQKIFEMGDNPSTFLGRALFRNLDALVISTLDGPSPPYGFDNTHFSIDNVRLQQNRNPSPVPLPAAFGPFATVLVGAGLWLRRKRAKSA